MSLNVRIVSEETVKPSSLPPPHLRVHKLSCMDQASPPRYMPALFSYPTTNKHDSSSQNDVVEKLKSSLATTLTHYYPFAGRFRDDGVSVDCNGHGVSFVVAEVEGGDDVSAESDSPDENWLLQLIPCDPQHRPTDANGDLFLLAARVNFFKCGAIAVAICAWHGIADASSLCCFAQAWAATCRGDPRVIGLLKGAVVDYTSLFPSQDSLLRGALAGYHKQPSDSSNKMTTSQTAASTSRVAVKRFCFPGAKITALREKIMTTSGARRLTRVETISSLFWAAAIRVAQQKRKEKVASEEEADDEGVRFHSAVMVVNIRTRTSPPLPDVCMGNLIQPTVAVKWPIDNEMATREDDESTILLLGGLAAKLGEAVRTVNAEHLKKLHENNAEGYLNLTRSFAAEYAKEDFIMISSSCRYPFYETDFGWGRPGSAHGFSRSNKTVVLLDARDGEGIEAWVTLDRDDMSMLEKDSGLLHYAC